MYNKIKVSGISNRLIALLIILIFIWIWTYIFFYKEKPQNNSNIYKDNIQKTKTEKNVSLIKINNNSEDSFFKISIQNKIELQKKKNIILKKKIAILLNLEDYRNLFLTKIEWDKNKFFIQYKNKEEKIISYIYSIKTKKLQKIKFHIPVVYIKYYSNTLYIVTKKGIFSYKNSNLTFFSNFNDFIILNWIYIGIVKDISKKKNLGFWNKLWNLIVLQDSKLNKKRLLYEPNFEIKKILLEDNNIIIVSKNDERFLLKY